MIISVTGQSAEVTEPDMLVSNSVNVYTVTFTFNTAWDGLTKMAVFKPGTKTNPHGTPIIMSKVSSDGTVKVPWEVLAQPGNLLVGVYGTKDTATVMPTVWADAGVIKPGTDTEGQNAQEPTPSEYSQIESEIAALAAKISAGGGGTGTAGRGITSVAKTSTSGLVDTYTITYSDSTTSTFTVTNGAEGAKGDTGLQGAKGDTGVQGAKGDTGATGADGHTPVKGTDYWTSSDISSMESDIKTWATTEILGGSD